MRTLKFAVDTKHRKEWFTDVSFSHPAKMSLPLLRWLVLNYTKEGETILDCMAGSGTALVACSLGRNVIAVELESKFCDIMKGNWKKIQERGPEMGYSFGKATIIHGDARNLSGLLADTCLFSPPYSEAKEGGGLNKRENWVKHLATIRRDPNAVSQVSWTEYRNPDNPDNIGSLPYGDIQAVITSPPFGEQDTSAHPGVLSPMIHTMGKANRGGTGHDSPSNIGNLKYGEIDHILTSPPYAATDSASDKKWLAEHPEACSGTWGRWQQSEYAPSPTNIGNLKSSNYLEAMLLVYQECFKVLKPDGLLCLVLKNFIRDRKVVRLDLDTIKLCESCGFVLKETLQRELPSQSFWRVIYKQRYPDAPEIKYEDVLVLVK